MPWDTKFHVFHGRVEFVQLDIGRLDHPRRTIIDRAWHPMPFELRDPWIEGVVPRPANLDLMIELAETLASGFDFVRVDFYDTSAGIFFGKMTFYPASGLMPYRPVEWDRRMGDLWNLERPA